MSRGRAFVSALLGWRLVFSRQDGQIIYELLHLSLAAAGRKAVGVFTGFAKGREPAVSS